MPATGDTSTLAVTTLAVGTMIGCHCGSDKYDDFSSRVRKRAHSKMGVYKKLKRVFSFKKDKEGQKDKSDKRDKYGKKYGTSDALQINESSEHRTSDVDGIRTDSLQRGGKKRSWSLKSIARKPSFGNKDKERKVKDIHFDATTEPAFLSDVIAPAPDVLTQQQSQQSQQQLRTSSSAFHPVTTIAKVETIAPPTLPLPLNPIVKADSKEHDVNNDNESDAPEKENDTEKDDFVVVTPTDVEEIKEYEAQLAAEGRSVHVNLVEEPESVENEQSQTATEEAAHANAEPQTIAEIINLLQELQDSAEPMEIDTIKQKTDTSDKIQSVCLQADAAIIASTDATKPLERTTTITTVRNGCANGHIKASNGSATATDVETSPAYMPASAVGQCKKLDIVPSKRSWQGRIAVIVVVAAILFAVALGINNSMRSGAAKAV
ncbi:uncharacterized protein LOC111267996 isoform X2 [Varroa jacobsoni]|uniref:uncharacterized protein LOC111267996 isoform X2 n=1 Tax=Varroa jacobsoni TaxID=62625 RepID=UPI000BFA0C6A|nr:uncharacterized protein LOC111267996 isoform X2 [Varroa jacobsoni]